MVRAGLVAAAVAVLTAVALVVGPAAPLVTTGVAAAAPQPSGDGPAPLTISPTSGPVGTQVTIFGEGCAAEGADSVLIVLVGGGGPSGGTEGGYAIPRAHVDQQGRFSATLRIPAQLDEFHGSGGGPTRPGAYTIGTLPPTCAAPFTVTDQPMPTITLTPSSGPVGTVFVVSGAGCPGDGVLTGSIIDGVEWQGAQAPRTDATGAWRAEQFVPEGVAPGVDWQVFADCFQGTSALFSYHLARFTVTPSTSTTSTTTTTSPAASTTTTTAAVAGEVVAATAQPVTGTPAYTG